MPETCSRKVAKFTLEDIDMFEDAHQNAQPGEANKFQRSWYGGLMTLAAVVVLVGVHASSTQ